jgi:hypothetical protein
MRQFDPSLGLIVAMLPLLAVGCSQSSATSSPPDGAGGSADAAGGSADAGTGSGNADALVGTFRVNLIAPVAATAMTAATPGHTAILGSVSDGVAPAGTMLEVMASEGACRLLRPRVPFCNTPCGGSAVCVANDTCQPYPKTQNVGATVVVKGIRTTAGATEFSMTAVGNNYQPPGDLALPYPPFDEGANLSITTSGGVYAPFTISAKGIAPLELLTGAVTVDRNQPPVTLMWKPPVMPSLAKIHLKLDISHHGGSKGEIDCDSDDTGSLVLPASLVTDLVGLGVSGFPSFVITRSSVGSTVITPGRVDLTVSSDVERLVTVPGFKDCTSDSECPTGQTCQPDLVCK